MEYIAVKSPNSSGAVKLTKLINELSCTNLQEKRRSNTPYFTCPSDFQASISVRVFILYRLIEVFSFRRGKKIKTLRPLAYSPLAR